MLAKEEDNESELSKAAENGQGSSDVDLGEFEGRKAVETHKKEAVMNAGDQPEKVAPSQPRPELGEGLSLLQRTGLQS